ncbi:hypothetical protein KC367_g89 [Hortaea werneckii]|nr:hypothetical protein KC367_g89 [Hortaea werneckii]
MTAQKQRTVCQALADQSSFQILIALRMSWAPPKLILNVTVQLPTRLNHPVIQEAIFAQSLVAIIADHEINETNTQPQMTVTACPSVNEMYSVVDKP